MYIRLYNTHMPRFVAIFAIIDCVAIKNLVTVVQENSTNQTAIASLDLVMASKDQEVHKAS